jgi:hypothetical protein
MTSGPSAAAMSPVPTPIVRARPTGKCHLRGYVGAKAPGQYRDHRAGQHGHHLRRPEPVGRPGQVDGIASSSEGSGIQISNAARGTTAAGSGSSTGVADQAAALGEVAGHAGVVGRVLRDGKADRCRRRDSYGEGRDAKTAPALSHASRRLTV